MSVLVTTFVATTVGTVTVAGVEVVSVTDTEVDV